MKKGITVSTLAITVAIMLIVTTTVSVVGVKSIGTAKFEDYKSKVRRVSDMVLEYYTTNKVLPTAGIVVARESLESELITELSSNGDGENRLYVVDMSILDGSSSIGKGNIENKDIFIIAENTNNVYYLQGYDYKGTVYFSAK